ncbi:MAG: hypothetical protein JJW03_00200 [Desulfosarcina sp.]|nr:hypothetical protein [Desulfobacterales bacterium]
MNIEDIAKVCHETNRAFCQTIGDNSQPIWEDAPEWQTESALFGVELYKENPNLPDSALHDSWMEQKVSDGWIYGLIKDADKKEHPCIVPFEALPEDQKAKDTLFSAVVSSLLPLLEE